MSLLTHILLELAALFALYWTLRTKKLVPAIISIAMIIGIVLVLYPDIQNKLYGLYVYMAACLLAGAYGVYQFKSQRISAYIILSMSVSIFLYWLWVTNHWHGNEIYFPVIALIAGGLGLLTKARLRNELGFLIILGMDAIVIILEKMLK